MYSKWSIYLPDKESASSTKGESRAPCYNVYACFIYSERSIHIHLGTHPRHHKMAKDAPLAIMYMHVSFMANVVYIYLGTHRRHRQRARTVRSARYIHRYRYRYIMYMHVPCIANKVYIYLIKNQRRRQRARAATPAIM